MNVNHPVGMNQQPQFQGLWSRTKEAAKDHPYMTATAAGVAAVALTPITLLSVAGAAVVGTPAVVKGVKTARQEGGIKQAWDNKTDELALKYVEKQRNK